MKLLVKDILNNFDLELLNPQEADILKEIKGAPVTRAGLELSGMIEKDVSYIKTVIGWGTKENKYILNLPDNKKEEAIKNVLDIKTPLVILSKGFVDKKSLDALIKIANTHKVGIARYKGHLADIISKITEISIISNAKPNPIHGSLIVVNGVGVLIKGRSGIGKSEAQLELIQKGHVFVSDDSVQAIIMAGEVYGKSSPITKDLIEVRGIGIINIPFTYGARAVVDMHKISLVVELLPPAKLNEVDRLGNENIHMSILGVDVSLIQIPTGSGRSVASLIEAAASSFIARKNGMDPLKIMKERRKLENDE